MTWFRAAGLSALAAPILMWGEFLTMGSMRHGYNLLTQPFSQLAAVGTPNAKIFDLGFFIVPGILTVLLGLGLWMAVRSSLWRLGVGLILASGVFLIATGIFPMDYHSSSETYIHWAVSQICFACASLAPLVLFIGSRFHLHISPPRQAWLITGLVAISIEVLGSVLHPVFHYPDGFFQRSITLSLTAWSIATGIWLLQHHQRMKLSALPEPI